MKRIIYILSIAVLSAACTRGLDLGRQEAVPPVEGDKVTLEFSIPVPPQTKAVLSDQPDLTDQKMYVLVFNTTTGALLEAPEATFTAVTAEGEANAAAYSVEVTLGSSPRALHFLLNAPTYEKPAGAGFEVTELGYAADPVLLGDTEAAVWKKLYTSNREAAYWQRVALPDGIHAYTYKGGTPVHLPADQEGRDKILNSYSNNDTPDDLTDDYYYDTYNNKVNEGDYINRVGRKIVDGEGYFASDDVTEKVASVPMVRNFAKITLKSSASNFTLEKAVLANVPAYGYVAPYYSAGNTFVPGNMTATLDAATVAASGYDAPMPSGTIITTCPDVTDCTAVDSEGNITLFTFERGIPEADPTCLLVCGTFNGKKDTWFKVDITNESGVYVPLYRAFNYPMDITSIESADGFDSIGDAFANPALGDVSGSPETQTLTKIANGKGLNMWVDFIDYTYIGTGTGIQLRYKIWDDNGTNYSSSAKAVVKEHKTSEKAVGKDKDAEINTTQYEGSDTLDGETGWYYIAVPLTATGDNIKRSVVRITGSNSDGSQTLYRDITFSVYPHQTMTLNATPLASESAGATSTLSITLPPSLGFSMFPLVFQIEALAGNINPANTETDIPADFGETLFNGVEGYTKTGQSIYYLKTVNYDDYDPENGTTITVSLKTTKAGSSSASNATTLIVADQKGYFNKATTELTVNP